MPIICRFFGVIVRMFYDDHNPPHIHVEYQDQKATLDFRGNILRGGLESKTALKLIREWVDLHTQELLEDWELAKSGQKIKEIDPLN